ARSYGGSISVRYVSAILLIRLRYCRRRCLCCQDLRQVRLQAACRPAGEALPRRRRPCRWTDVDDQAAPPDPRLWHRQCRITAFVAP
ncbi:MAG TPA: hypothetical protein VGC82_22385, partial [Rhodopila sp.]